MGSFSWLKAQRTPDDNVINVVQGSLFKFLIPKEFGGGFIIDKYRDYGYLGDSPEDEDPKYDMYELESFWADYSNYIEGKELNVEYDGEIYPLMKQLDDYTDDNRDFSIRSSDYEIETMFPLKMVSFDWEGTYEECEGYSHIDPHQGFGNTYDFEEEIENFAFNYARDNILGSKLTLRQFIREVINRVTEEYIDHMVSIYKKYKEDDGAQKRELVRSAKRLIKVTSTDAVLEMYDNLDVAKKYPEILTYGRAYNRKLITDKDNSWRIKETKHIVDILNGKEFRDSHEYMCSSLFNMIRSEDIFTITKEMNELGFYLFHLDSYGCDASVFKKHGDRQFVYLKYMGRDKGIKITCSDNIDVSTEDKIKTIINVGIMSVDDKIKYWTEYFRKENEKEE